MNSEIKIKKLNDEAFEYSFELKNPHVEKYFNMDSKEIEYYNNWQNEGIIDYIINVLNKKGFNVDNNLVKVENGILKIYLKHYNNEIAEFLGDAIRDFYTSKEMHITRMFGSYIIIQKINNELKAVKATPIPIKYCPLMYKLLKEVAGEYASGLLETLQTNDTTLQTEYMCNLINETVIKTGYFDTNRPLNWNSRTK